MCRRYLGLASAFLVLLGVALPPDKAHAVGGCEVRSSLFAVPNLTFMGVPLCDVNGAQWVSMATLISGEDTTNLLLRVSGGAVRSITAMTGVTTNTTSANFTIFSGGKTPIAQVSGTGAVTATVQLYGDNDSTPGNGVLLSTITMSGTTKVVSAATQFTTDYPFYYAVSSNVTGTGATVEFVIASGIAGSGTGSGGGGDASAANQLTGNASLTTIAGAVSGTGVNVSQINGVTPLMGNGVTGTGSPRVTEATDSQLSAGVGSTGDAATTFGAAGSLSAKMRLLTNLTLDPCTSQAKTFIQINQTTGTQVNTGTAANRSYVCGFSVMSATLQNIAIISGTGVICATGSNPMYGGVTAATGFQLAANAGVVLGTGGSTVMKTKTDADNICIVQSGAGQVSGVMSIVTAIN